MLEQALNTLRTLLDVIHCFAAARVPDISNGTCSVPGLQHVMGAHLSWMRTSVPS